MKQTYDSSAFNQFFKVLGLIEQQDDNILTHKYIKKFLKLIKSSSYDQSAYIEQQKDPEAVKWTKTLEKIYQIQNNSFENKRNNYQINHHNPINEENESQIIKAMQKCFILAAKSQNNSYFISKIMELSENSQIYFADLLKPECPVSPASFSHENPEIGHNERLNEFLPGNAEIQIIDKLYEYEQQIEKLHQEIKRVLQHNIQITQQNKQIKVQIGFFKDQNEKLRVKTLDQEQIIEQLKEQYQNRKNKSGKKQFENMQIDVGLANKSIRQYRDEIDILKLQNDSIIRKFQKKVSQLIDQLKTQRQKIKKQIQINLDLKESNRILTLKYQQIKEQIEEIIKKVENLQKKNDELQQNEATLKFQLNYKNSQIQELKELMMNNSRDAHSNSNDPFLGIKSNILENQFQNQYRNSSSLSEDYRCFNTVTKMNNKQQQELRNLRIQVKEYQQQIQSLTHYRTKNKQLQYEKKKLLKILKQYEKSRGQENDIIVGCLYQIRKQMMNKQEISRKHEYRLYNSNSTHEDEGSFNSAKI